MGDLLSPFGVNISTPSQYDYVCVIQLHGTKGVKGIGIVIQVNAPLLTLMVHFLLFNCTSKSTCSHSFRSYKFIKFSI